MISSLFSSNSNNNTINSNSSGKNKLNNIEENKLLAIDSNNFVLNEDIYINLNTQHTNNQYYLDNDLNEKSFSINLSNNFYEKLRLKLTTKYVSIQKKISKNKTKTNTTPTINNIANSNGNIFDINNNNQFLNPFDSDLYEYQQFSFANTILKCDNNEKPRVVSLKRDPIYGLGLCVKGGKEHNLPLLISNMFKNQPADLCGNLNVGDAILKVNDIDITQLTHDQAVHILKTTNALHSPALLNKNLSKSSTSLNKASSPSSTSSSSSSSAAAAIATINLPSSPYDVILTVKNYSTILENFRNNTASLSTNEISNTSAPTALNRQNSTGKLIKENLSTIAQHDATSSSSSTNNDNYWIDLINIPLELAHVTEYIAGTDKIRNLGFEIYSKHGISSGVLICETVKKKQELLKQINNVIKNCNLEYINNINKMLMPSEQITYMCWSNERIHYTHHNWSCWTRVLISIKGFDCYLFDNCDLPQNINEWSKCKRVYRVYESLFKLIKEHEQLDERNNCFVLHNCNGTAHYMNVDTEEQLNLLDKHWQRTLYTSVYSIGSKSFNCNYENKQTILFIDIHKGFILINNETNEIIWSYQFSQLKTSTDDNQCKLQFYFQDAVSKRIEVKKIECNDLYSLLYVIHSFLTAKLKSVNINSIK